MVVDDGSTDNTQARLEPFRTDPRFRELSLNRSGVATARNAGLAATSDSELVAFIDSDDIWMPYHLEDGIGFLDLHPEVSLFFAGIQLSDKTRERDARDGLRKRAKREAKWRRPLSYIGQQYDEAAILDPGEWYGALLRSETNPPTPTVIVRRKSTPGSAWFDTELEVLEDADFYFRLARDGHLFSYSEEPHAVIRYHGDNLTMSYDLASPTTLHRKTAALQVRKSKLEHCEDPEDAKWVSKQVAEQSYLVAQCYWEQSRLREARSAYRESLRYGFSYRALKGWAAAALPKSAAKLLKSAKEFATGPRCGFP